MCFKSAQASIGECLTTECDDLIIFLFDIMLNMIMMWQF